MFKRKKIKRTTIFDLPIKEGRYKIVEMKKHIYRIIESEKFIDIATKIPVPVNATSKDVDKLLKQYAPKKMKEILELLFEDNFDDFMHIGALLFCEDYNLYTAKSFNQILSDFGDLTQTEVGSLINLFTRAGR